MTCKASGAAACSNGVQVHGFLSCVLLILVAWIALLACGWGHSFDLSNQRLLNKWVPQIQPWQRNSGASSSQRFVRRLDAVGISIPSVSVPGAGPDSAKIDTAPRVSGVVPLLIDTDAPKEGDGRPQAALASAFFLPLGRAPPALA